MSVDNSPKAKFTALAASIVDADSVAHEVVARATGHHRVRKSPAKKLANSQGNDTSVMLESPTTDSVKLWLSRTVARSVPQALKATDEQIAVIVYIAKDVAKLRNATNAEQTDLMLRVGKYAITGNAVKLAAIRKEVGIRLTKQKLTTPIPGTFTTRTITDPDEPATSDKLDQTSRNSMSQYKRGF